MKLGYKALLEAAESEIETLNAKAAEARLDDDVVVFVDLRDVRELWREGTVPGAFHAPRGMLEFWVDPDSPYHKPLPCASGAAEASDSIGGGVQKQNSNTYLSTESGEVQRDPAEALVSRSPANV